MANCPGSRSSNTGTRGSIVRSQFMTADYNQGDLMLMTLCDELHVVLLVVGQAAVLRPQ